MAKWLSKTHVLPNGTDMFGGVIIFYSIKVEKSNNKKFDSFIKG